MLYVNADDLGWIEEITDRILTCYLDGRINSASAMTFMKDSERAAELARQHALPVGLHLNLTEDFTGPTVAGNLRDQHRAVAAYLTARKVNQILLNFFLQNAFDYVFQAQWDEFCRLYGKEPTRLDGHHHMHLCMNMLACIRRKDGLKVRRHFTFSPGEKGPINRLYRRVVDGWLSGRFEIMDHFCSLVPMENGRLSKLVYLSRERNVEIMVHPGVDAQYRYLMSDDWSGLLVGQVSHPDPEQQ